MAVLYAEQNVSAGGATSAYLLKYLWETNHHKEEEIHGALCSGVEKNYQIYPNSSIRRHVIASCRQRINTIFRPTAEQENKKV